jgi:hypothetical protein
VALVVEKQSTRAVALRYGFDFHTLKKHRKPIRSEAGKTTPALEQALERADKIMQKRLQAMREERQDDA